MKLVSTHRLGVVLERPTSTNQFLACLGVIGGNHPVVDQLRHLVDGALGLEVQDLPAVHAELLLAGRLLFTAGAGQRRQVRSIGLGGLDVLPHHRRELGLLGLAGELPDVASDGLRAADAALSVLDERLGLALEGEPVGVGLPEVRRRHRFIDVSASSGLFETLEEALVAEPVGLGELRPEVVVTTTGMLADPAFEVLRGHDQVDVVGAALPVGTDLQRVLRVGDVSDLQVVEFAPAEPTLVLDGQQRLVPRVLAGVDHRDDLGIPVEHLRLVGFGVVVPSGSGRDPVVRVGDFLAASEVLREDAEGDAVVPVRLLATLLDVVGLVNPRDNLLRSVLAGVERLVAVIVALLEERVVEADLGVLADSDEMPEHLLVAGVSVVFATDAKLVTELQQEFPVALTAATITAVESGAHPRDGSLPVDAHTPLLYPTDVKGRVKRPSSAYSVSFTVPKQPVAAPSPESTVETKGVAV